MREHWCGTRAEARCSPQGSLGQSPSRWAPCHATQGSCGRDWFFCGASVLCNLWPQVPSPNCLQGDGRGIPLPVPIRLDSGSAPGPPFRTLSSAGQGEGPTQGLQLSENTSIWEPMHRVPAWVTSNSPPL